MKNYLNPIAISEMDAYTITEAHQYENSIYDEVYPPIADPNQYDTMSIINAEYEKHREQMGIEEFMDHWERTMHQTADSVIAEIKGIEADDRLSPFDKTIQIAHIYAHMSPEMCANRDEMMALTAYRADAMLWANSNLMDINFVKEAIQYNPLAYDVASAMYTRRAEVIDVYRDALYGDGPKEHPATQDKHHTPTEHMLSPRCSIYAMYAAYSYKEMFEKVLLNQRAHTPTIDPVDGSIHASQAVKFLATCESEHVTERHAEMRIAAYQENLETLRQQAVRDSVVRENLGGFCFHHGLAPEPEWAREFVQAQETELQEMSHRITNGRTSSYPQDVLYEVCTLQNKLSTDIAAQQFTQFWQDVGVAVTEARGRINANDYGAHSPFSRSGDMEFLSDIKEAIQYNAHSQLIKENVNAGIAQERDRQQEFSYSR